MTEAHKTANETDLLIKQADLAIKNQQVELIKAQIRREDAETDRVKKATATMG